ncbi:MAG: acetyl-CoA hydrolase/transferase C-terminal domain-containing protein, partial [Oscillospiraceae bacterium]
KLTNKRKNIFPGKGVLGLATGSQALYDWLDENPGVIALPIAYVNDPAVIGSMDNFISLNSCVSIDLYGQINSESAGLRHISGTGGQVDFLGAAIPRAARVICVASSASAGRAQQHRAALPTARSSPPRALAITSPRAGRCEPRGRPPGRAEPLLAHPDLRATSSSRPPRSRRSGEGPTSGKPNMHDKGALGAPLRPFHLPRLSSRARRTARKMFS